MTKIDDTGALTLEEEGRAVPIPWRLAPGNFANLYWTNYQGRMRETQGVIIEVRDGMVSVNKQGGSKSEVGGELIHLSRIVSVDVIVEGDAAKEIRKRVWELTRQAAACINSKSEWDRDGYFAAWRSICEILPELKES